MDTESPNSNADSAVKSLEDGLTYFVKPFESVRLFFEGSVFVFRPFFLGSQGVLREERNSFNARISPQRRNLT